MEQEHRAHKLRELVVHSPKAYARLAKLLSETGEEGVLFCLLHSDGSLQPGELAARLDLTSGRIANILRSLESKGLVQRESVDQDGRKMRVFLSESGKRYAARQEEITLSQQQALMEHLGEEDAREMLRLLEKCLRFCESGFF